MSDEPELSTTEIARVLRLYEGPPQPRPTRHRAGARRALGRLVPVTAAFVCVVGATAAVAALLTGGGQDRMHAALSTPSCTPTLALGGRRYVERAVDAGRTTPGRSLGGGLLRPCGPAPAEVTTTALAGIDARRAVAVRGKRGLIYVAPSCGRAPAARLLACLLAPR